MELDLTFFAVAIPATVLAGISKGGFGSGVGFVATALMALILQPGAAIGVMLPLLMVMDFSALKPYWRKWDGPAAGTLILGGVPGVVIGALLYRAANPDVLRFLIGLIAVVFVAFQLGRYRGWIRPARRPMPRRLGVFFGAGAGFTSFISHAGGPMAAIYMLSRRLDKQTYQATTVIAFLAINLAKLVPYTLLGIFTGPSLRADLYLVPFAFVGVWLGVRVHRIVPERLFFLLIYVFLSLTGTKLILDALG